MSKRWLCAPALCLLLQVPGTSSMAQSVGADPHAALGLQPSDECFEDYALVYPCLVRRQGAGAPQSAAGTSRQFAHRTLDKDRRDAAHN